MGEKMERIAYVLDRDSEDLYNLLYWMESSKDKSLACRCKGEYFSPKEVAIMSSIDKKRVDAGLPPLKGIIGPACFLLLHCKVLPEEIERVRMKIKEDCQPYPEQSVWDLSSRGGMVLPIIYDESREGRESEFFNPLERREENSELELTVDAMLAERSIEVDGLKPREFGLVLATIPGPKGRVISTHY